MAALLRSARLLKNSSSSLLQVIGNSRHAPAAGRLYSGVVGAPRLGFSVRHAAPGRLNVNSLFSHRLAVPCVSCRQYGVVPEQSGEINDELGVHAKQIKHFDWALAKLDSSVRRTGRVTKTLLQRIFHDICRSGYPSGNHALLLLRSCGSLLPEVPLAERTELVERIWNKLQELGITYDVSHYNALLKTYLQNEFRFSPTDFLAKMEAANVQPNRVTYQRLIAAYCEEGDTEGASAILGFMKSKDMPITEAVFSSLVTGHARAGDMNSAEGILSIMKEAGIEPGPDTYLSLINAYAEKGNIDKVKETLDAVEKSDIYLMDRDLMQVVSSLTKAGHEQYVPEIVARMHQERVYVPDAMNLCMSLITLGHERPAFYVLKSLNRRISQSQTDESQDFGNFFLRHCVNMDKSVETIVEFCKELKDSGVHSSPLLFTLHCALEGKKTGMAVELMKKVSELEHLPIRPHYFWPLFAHHLNTKNTSGMIEVLKGMKELGVVVDADSFSYYVLPAFQSVDTVLASFKEAGVDVDGNILVLAELRNQATSGNLTEVLSIMSSPTLPSIHLSSFRTSLILGFKGFRDVPLMAKITELLYKDDRFSPKTDASENVGFFIYRVIEAMDEANVELKEEKIREYFRLLKDMNIVIPLNICRGIRKLLESYNVPELVKDVFDIADSGKNSTNVAKDTEASYPVTVLERTLAELKDKGSSGQSAFRKGIILLCNEEKLEQALELKRQYDDYMTPATYALLIGLCCRHDRVEEALKLKMELARKDSEVVLGVSKYISLVRALAQQGRLEEAIDMLKEMKEKNVMLEDNFLGLFGATLNSVALKGDPNTVRSLMETVFTLGLAKPSTNLCAPLISWYLHSGDYAGAFDAVLECHKQYNLIPKVHELTCVLVEKGETLILHKVMEFLTLERGEMMMLYDLFFAFLQTGRVKEAQRIIETPGLRARTNRLQWFAEKCISGKQMESLENMVDLTAKLFECDRDEMYHYLLRLCKETNDWRKAEAVWTKMQEENLAPRERTLRLLADILQSNNQEVPFEVPKVWFEDGNDLSEKLLDQEELTSKKKASPNKSKGVSEADSYTYKIQSLCNKNKVQEAFSVLQKAEERDVLLSSFVYDVLIKALLSGGSIEDALAVKNIAVGRIPEFTFSENANSLLIISHVKNSQVKDAMRILKDMIQADQLPSRLAVLRLVQSCSNEGDLERIQELESLVKSIGSISLSNLLFVGHRALAHIKNGEIDSAVETLESCYMQEQKATFKFILRKVLQDNNDAALDKLSAMAERLCNHFASYRAATDLFLAYLDEERTEEAKFLLQRCAAIYEQKDKLFTHLLRWSQKQGQSSKVKTLIEMIPDIRDKSELYGQLMKAYDLDQDLESAKALYEKMQAEGMEGEELTLKRLASMYKKAGENPPFEEPKESFQFYAKKLRQKKEIDN